MSLKMCLFVANVLLAMSVLIEPYPTWAATIDEEIRGVPFEKLSFYNPTTEFSCLDGSKKMPFSHVNDDYCDCPDGTDEPGTSACPNGLFTCVNKGYKPKIIPSSRVNDGVCDCCDGTDEWANLFPGRTPCSDRCLEVGESMRLEQEKMQLAYQRGQTDRSQALEQAKQLMDEKRKRLDELKSQQSGLQTERDQAEAEKQEAEVPESAAKEVHQKKHDELVAAHRQEQSQVKARRWFDILDANSDSYISLDEIQQRNEFDVDQNGEVSVEEAQEHLEGKQVVAFEEFQTEIWPNINELLAKATAPQPPPPPADVDGSSEEDHTSDDYEEPTTPAVEPVATPDPNEEQPEPAMTDYDEETKQLIATADAARQKYEDLRSQVEQIDNEIAELNKLFDIDFGPDSVFLALKDQCFELVSPEYRYKFCPFSKCTQEPKHGGHATSLGSWGRWSGSTSTELSRFKQQLYENGEYCWNGPHRSTTVNIRCGLENKLLSSSEPSRCTYEFVFETPLACHRDEAEEAAGESFEMEGFLIDSHDEL